MTTSTNTIFDPKIIQQAIQAEMHLIESNGTEDLTELLDDIKQAVIDTTLVHTRGNKVKAARCMGIHRQTLNYWLNKKQMYKRQSAPASI